MESRQMINAAHSWERRPSICRAHHVLLVNGKPNGWWIHAVQHPTANRPYTVHRPNGEAVGPNLSTLINAKNVLLTAMADE
jgi:hypothetical protein